MKDGPKKAAIRMIEARGWLWSNAENRVSRTCTEDLFGFVDLVVLTPVSGIKTWGIQVTSKSHTAERQAKIEAAHQASTLDACNWGIEVWGIDGGSDDPKSIKARFLTFEGKKPVWLHRSLLLSDAM